MFLHETRNLAWARMHTHFLPPETFYQRYARHGELWKSRRQNPSTTHILFTPHQNQPWKHIICIYDMRIYMFWGHSLHRVVFPLRHIARAMGVENIGHPRFRLAHFHPRLLVLRLSIPSGDGQIHLDETLFWVYGIYCDSNGGLLCPLTDSSLYPPFHCTTRSPTRCIRPAELGQLYSPHMNSSTSLRGLRYKSLSSSCIRGPYS